MFSQVFNPRLTTLISGEGRKALYDSVKEVCRDLGAEGHLLDQEELVDFIMGDTIKYQWTAQLLPREAHFLENTMLATHSFVPQLVYC